MSHTLLVIVLIPFVAALLASWAGTSGRLLSAWVSGAATLLALLLLIPPAIEVAQGELIIQRVEWLPALGLDLALRLDGLGLLFALMILIIGFLVIVYARWYLSERDPMGRFYAYLLLFQGAMLGMVLSENLLLLLVFWELTSISSFLLISYWRHLGEARQGARMALAITGGGGLALLGGVLLLGHIVGSYDLSVVLASAEVIQAHPLYAPALVLILLGAFTKSAQFPFHFWLPHAMAAPTPVSAYLHSATMVKAGVFLLARLFPALSGTDLWTWLVVPTGLATLLIGAYTALFKHDLKGLLAYSTISHLGLITLLFGIGTPLGAVAAVFHIMNHATFKASLFMAAGIIDHEAGTRDMRKLGGLWKYMPYTGMLAMVAAAAMAGVPLLNGFLSKEMFFEKTVYLTDVTPSAWIVPAVATLAGAFAVAYSLRFIHDVFFNGPGDMPRVPHEPPRWMKVPVEILVVICVAVGILPGLTFGPMLSLAGAATLQAELPYYSLKLWHGFTPALWMSVAALAGGVLIYMVRKPLFRLHDTTLAHFDARAVFLWGEERLGALAGWLNRLLHPQALQRMLALTLGMSALAIAGGLALAPMLAAVGANAASDPLAVLAALRGPATLTPVDLVSVAAALCLAAATLAAVIWHRRRWRALVLVSVVGLVVSLAFVKLSAPDLALTQLLVEVVTTILLLLALYFLPAHTPSESSWARRIRDLGIASVLGALTAALTWGVLTRPQETIAGWFIDNSKPGGGGTNVVNVILVDFRGFDTLGEISVLAIAAIGIYMLLDGIRLSVPATDGFGQHKDWDHHPLILATFSRLLLPLALLVGVFILLRGHNLPGGGFIAGLVVGVAIILQYLANGIAWARTRITGQMHPLIGLGLLVATATGLASLYFGYPFLTSTHEHFHPPLVGHVELASAMLFDIGVLMVVVGITLVILIGLGEVSLGKRREDARPGPVFRSRPEEEA